MSFGSWLMITDIGLNSTYDSMRASSCTSCEIMADKSAYWTPQLYYERGTDGAFIEVPNSGMTVYYLGRGVNAANIVPYPPGFRMISGNMFARSYDNTTMTWSNSSQYPPRPIADRVTFNCIDSSGPLPQLNYLWRTNCSGGLRAQLKFQSCWDGVNTYLPNSAHVAYMSSLDNGICPPTHPVQLVELFFEVLYSVNSMNQSDGGRFVFSYGDPTGYGFHGDFLNGWDQDVLTASLAQCANVDNGGVASACAPLSASGDDVLTYQANCPENYPNAGPLINETVHGNVGTQLPGCITIVDGPEPANISDVTCDAGVPTPSINSYPAQTPIVYSSPTPGQYFSNAGWQYLSCFQDYYNNYRTMTQTVKQSNALTVESCQTYCAGLNYPYAGLEYGEYCFCGSTFNSSAPSNMTGCTMMCTGNNTEYCGGPARIAIYSNAALSPTSSKGSASTSSTSTTSLTRTTGTSSSVLSTKSSTSTKSASTSSLSMTSTSKTSQRSSSSASATSPSSSSTLSRTSSSASQATAPAVGIYVGCATDPSTSARALNASSYTSSGNMTLENCRSYCDGLGYFLSGTEYSTQCFCGNALVNGGTILASNATCSMACSNNTAQKCGGSSRLSVYNSTVVTALPSILPSTQGYTYQGCYSDSTTRTLSGSSYANSTGMTAETCVKFCSTAGYSLAGIEYGQQCYCANTMTSGALTTDSQCSSRCAGNRYEYCGGGWRLSVYSRDPPAAAVAVHSSATTSSAKVTAKKTSTTKTSTAKSVRTQT